METRRWEQRSSEASSYLVGSIIPNTAFYQLLQIMTHISPEEGWNRVVNDWNTWRQAYPDIKPDLSGISFSGEWDRDPTSSRLLYSVRYHRSVGYPLIDFINREFSKNLPKYANLSGINLSGADLQECEFDEVNLSGANLSFSNLYCASFYGANLASANLTSSNLQKADLGRTNLIGANFEGANLSECFAYGISAWDIKLQNTIQSDIIITRPWQYKITVDNLEVAQFIYLLLENPKIRKVIDTIAKKAVLILGRFTPERKAILDGIRDELRKNDYLPILFDFDEPTIRDIHETITTLARLARFVIADITNPKSIPQELVSIVETLPSLPIQPLLQGGSKPWGMYGHIKRYPWVLPIYRYTDEISLLQSLKEKVIEPAEQKAKELEKR